ncbi:hypothetical protein BSKO_09366 [Bryopsis sp. KO-2023]|nr:hypothetical protein BSKO_09366 [Bryopsis sp. KO-2023]
MRAVVTTFALGCLLMALPTFAQKCDVWLLGSGLCACYDNDHCAAGSGCLTKTCGKSSCRFPRICFCKPNSGTETGTSNCSPVKSGPCENCYPPQSLRADTDRSTPKDVLVWEYGTLNSFDLRERVAQAGLSTEGTDEELRERLADFALDQEIIET